ncbi:hypothetical protein CpipJ_CPIJ007183 [Culex quinquefasciatus]|uniref:Uncharacterized protein n=1 Tax=Culex quinquefasciatus TaxID=7176 RepID=B0WJ54_CULQU|nr:hypothetical protein CpipJ_CPIJ007183 [Culex quinquefasciatus]|eukprot:XP_001848738.1 hypothetical protein CpipJ_CPIJ007183 [Culex quinquefasciatus]
MFLSVKTETARRREVEDVPDQANLDAGCGPLAAGEPATLSAAAQQQHFHHSPFLQRPPPHAASYVECFEQQRGYVQELFRQQQEALQRQLVEMQQQQLAFMQHQQQFISSIVTSMKVQAQPCLDSLGSGNAEEFETDPDGDGVSTAWHNRHEELLQEKKVHSLDKLAEVHLCRSDGGGAKVLQQQVLAGSCEACGCCDDVIEHLSEANHDFKVHSPPDPWPKPTGPWQSGNVEFTGLTEVPLSLIVNVNIGCLLVQFGSAVINRTQSIADAAKDNAGRSTDAVHHNTLQTGWRFGECIRSKLEYEPPPSPSATTRRGEQQKRKFCLNVPDAINRKVGRVLLWTVDLRAVRRISCYGLEKRFKSIDVRSVSRKHQKSSAVSSSTAPTRFGTSKQRMWSLGRPPEHPRIGGTVLPTFVSSRTSTTATPSRSVAC